MFKRFTLWLRSVRHAATVVGRNRNRKPASAWDTALATASEELLDDHDLGVTISLPAGITYEDIVGYILGEARNNPDYKIIVDHLCGQFGLEHSEADRAVDRTLGGIVRAAFRRPDLSPDLAADPIAWHSFQKASENPAIVDEIFGGWKLPDVPADKATPTKPLLRAISELKEEDFLKHPVWTWAEEDDESLVEPVKEYDPLPEDHDALFVAGRLTLANGQWLNGTISVRCSDKKVYLLEAFVGPIEIGLPLLNTSDFKKAIGRFAEATKLAEQQIFPLRYTTDFHFKGESPISGEVSTGER